MIYERLPVNNREEYLEAMRRYLTSCTPLVNSKEREEKNIQTISEEAIKNYKAPAKA